MAECKATYCGCAERTLLFPSVQTAFGLEPLTPSLFDEMAPLLVLHWREVAQFKDIPLAPAFASYLEREAAGNLRVFTVRGEPAPHRFGRDECYVQHERCGKLHGYAVFFVQPNPHYTTSLQASADILFLHPDVRARTAMRFIKWCDDQLAGEGCDLVYQRVKLSKDWSPILTRIGYTPVDLTLVKDLRSARVEAPV